MKIGSVMQREIFEREEEKKHIYIHTPAEGRGERERKEVKRGERGDEERRSAR